MQYSGTGLFSIFSLIFLIQKHENSSRFLRKLGVFEIELIKLTLLNDISEVKIEWKNTLNNRNIHLK